MIKLNKEFKMSKYELATFRALSNDKPNLPETKLNKEETNFIHSLYRKYIVTNVDNQDWNLSLEEMERKEKWPSGNRVTMLQAQRMIIGFLEGINERGNMTDKQGAKYFLGSLRCRESFKRLAYYAYIN